MRRKQSSEDPAGKQQTRRSKSSEDPIGIKVENNHKSPDDPAGTKVKRNKSSDDPVRTNKKNDDSTWEPLNPPSGTIETSAQQSRTKRNAGGLWWSFLSNTENKSVQRIEYPHLQQQQQQKAIRRQRIEHVLNVVMLTIMVLLLATMGMLRYSTKNDDQSTLQSKKRPIIVSLQNGTPRKGQPPLPRIDLPREFWHHISFPPQQPSSEPLVRFPQRINYFRASVFAHINHMQNPEQYLDDDRYEDDEAGYMDFGAIDLKFLDEDGQSRQIYHDMAEYDGQNYRSLDQELDDDVTGYYAFDDDIQRNPYLLYDDDAIGHERHCRRTNWHRLNFPTCNSMHELDLANQWFSFVGEGAYREVFLTKQSYLNITEDVIFKELLWDRDHEYEYFESIHMDALITERMSSNPRIVDLYSFCGMSMLTEYFAHGDIEDDLVTDYKRRKGYTPHEEPELTPRNDFTGSEKLRLALEMAQPIADLHNYEGGVIVHDDIQIVQFLWTDSTKTKIKLNDFNRAEIMLWDEENQEYCEYRNGYGMGDWRAPEEYRDHPLTEKIDIWSLGNNFYGLLTGHYPFMDTPTTAKVQKRIKRGDIPVVDKRYRARSFGESKLVEVIQRCYVYNAKRRADINEIVQMLRDAIAEDDRRRESGETEWGEENVPVEDTLENTTKVEHESDSNSEDESKEHDKSDDYEEEEEDGFDDDDAMLRVIESVEGL